jgi:carbamate kinase
VAARCALPGPLPSWKLIRHVMSAGIVVVCAGGGAVPVVPGEGGQLQGVEAVVDKDLTAALLAEALDADGLLMLSDLPVVDADYGTPGAANRSGHPRRNPQPKIPRRVDGL